MTWTRFAGTMLLAGTLAACSDTAPAGPDDVAADTQGDLGTVEIRLQQTGQIVTQLTSGWFASVAGTAGSAAAINPDTVASLVIRVTDIEFLPADEDDNGENGEDTGGWISLALEDTIELDLVALPTEGESPLVIAAGTVPVGDYMNVRLFVDSAAITFTGPISLGAAITFDGGVPHAVTIPSEDQTGIKTDASFSVTEDTEGNVTDVTLLFSAGSTFQNVALTGNGMVILAPVIRGQADESS